MRDYPFTTVRAVGSCTSSILSDKPTPSYLAISAQSNTRQRLRGSKTERGCREAMKTNSPMIVARQIIAEELSDLARDGGW